MLRTRRVRLTALLLAVGAFLRLLQLTSRSLWFDEAKTLVVSGGAWSEIPGLVRVLEGTPPLYFYLVKLWLAPFGDAALGLRLLSAAAGLGALLVFDRLRRRLLPEGAGLFALALACLCALSIHQAQDGRAYALLGLAGLAHFALTLAVIERWTARRGAALALLTAAGLWLHPYFAFGAAAHALAWLWARPRDLRRWLAVHAAAAAAFAPWLPSLAAQTRFAHTSLLTERLGPSQLAHVLGAFLIDLPYVSLASEAPSRAAGWPLLAGALAGLAALRRRPEGRTLAVAALVPFAVAAAAEVFLARALTQPRYFAAQAPLLLLWLAWATESLPPRAKLAARSALLLLSAAGAAGYLATAAIDPRLGELAAAIRSGSPEGAPVVHVQPFYYPSLRYHYLPERAHRLACAQSNILTWDGLPGYKAAASREEIAALGKSCVLVDPEAKLAGRKLGLVDCSQLAAALSCP